MSKYVKIYTDGACLGNPGPGGWGALLIYGDHEREISGGALHTTNNRMEIQAALEGLKALKTTCSVDIYTDSTYLKNGVTLWIEKWVKNGWKTAAKKEVLNQDLWQEMLPLIKMHTISWHWVKGHSNHPENDRVDALAHQAALRITNSL